MRAFDSKSHLNTNTPGHTLLQTSLPTTVPPHAQARSLRRYGKHRHASFRLDVSPGHNTLSATTLPPTKLIETRHRTTKLLTTTKLRGGAVVAAGEQRDARIRLEVSRHDENLAPGIALPRILGTDCYTFKQLVSTTTELANPAIAAMYISCAMTRISHQVVYPYPLLILNTNQQSGNEQLATNLTWPTVCIIPSDQGGSYESERGYNLLQPTGTPSPPLTISILLPAPPLLPPSPPTLP